VTTIIVKILEKYADHLRGFPRKGALADFGLCPGKKSMGIDVSFRIF
jgi:hypothetical protein